jgi:hypothetical protein
MSQENELFNKLGHPTNRDIERHVLKVNPHFLNLEKCSWASDKGKGRPTKVTAFGSSGNSSIEWFTGLKKSKKKRRIEVEMSPHFTISRKIDAA